MMDGRDDKERMEREIEIYRPLPGQTEVTSGPWSDDEMAASFRAAASQMS